MRTIKEASLWLNWDITSVTDEELLALLLNNADAARRVLDLAGGLVGLPLLTVQELLTVPGIGDAGAHRLRAALELNRRIALHALCRPQITTPDEVATIFMAEMARLDQEQLRVVLLNTKNRVLKIETLYIGTINGSTVRIAEVFKAAIRMNAAALIVVHNHPSGDPTPSPEDVLLTRQLAEAGRLLDVDVLDHLVIGHGRWVSLRERGLGFTTR
jgi:DNA repair protein RadC